MDSDQVELLCKIKRTINGEGLFDDAGSELSPRDLQNCKDPSCIFKILLTRGFCTGGNYQELIIILQNAKLINLRDKITKLEDEYKAKIKGNHNTEVGYEYNRESIWPTDFLARVVDDWSMSTVNDLSNQCTAEFVIKHLDLMDFYYCVYYNGDVHKLMVAAKKLLGSAPCSPVLDVSLVLAHCSGHLELVRLVLRCGPSRKTVRRGAEQAAMDGNLDLSEVYLQFMAPQDRLLVDTYINLLCGAVSNGRLEFGKNLLQFIPPENIPTVLDRYDCEKCPELFRLVENKCPPDSLIQWKMVRAVGTLNELMNQCPEADDKATNRFFAELWERWGSVAN